MPRQFAHNCSVLIVLEICFYLWLFCFVFFFPYSCVLLCVCVCAPVMDGKIRWVAEKGGYTKEDEIWKTQVQFVFEREAKRTGHTALKQEYKVYDSTSLEPGSLHWSMYSPVHIHLGGSTLRTRSKANNFIGGLHNSAPIPGVIVFPLRLSCTDESLMHSFLGIMDSTGQLQPGPAAGDGSEWMGTRSVSIQMTGRDGEHAGSRFFCVHIFDSSVCACVCVWHLCLYLIYL